MATAASSVAVTARRSDSATCWIEAGSPVGWQALSRPDDVVIGLERFGASAPGPQVYAALGFTPVRVAEAAAQAVQSVRAGRRGVI